MRYYARTLFNTQKEAEDSSSKGTRPKRKGHVKIYNKSSEIKSSLFLMVMVAVVVQIHSFTRSFIHSYHPYWLGCACERVCVLHFFFLVRSIYFFVTFLAFGFLKCGKKQNTEWKKKYKKKKVMTSNIFCASHLIVMPYRCCLPYTTFALQILVSSEFGHSMSYRTHTHTRAHLEYSNEKFYTLSFSFRYALSSHLFIQRFSLISRIETLYPRAVCVTFSFFFFLLLSFLFRILFYFCF